MDPYLTIRHEDTLEINADTRAPDPHQDAFYKTTLGFWFYLMTDCILFASIFVTYAVLRGETFGGPSSKELFDLPTAFIETLILLFSSVTCGFAILQSEKRKVVFWLVITFLLGASFLALELREFTHLVREGNDWTRSAFLSSFFTLVGTHGLHISIGLTWVAAMIFQVLWYGITLFTFRRLAVFTLYWHFLDLIWIFIFTFVYLLGVI